MHKIKNLIITSKKKLSNDLHKIAKKKKIIISKKFENYYNFEKKIEKFYEKINNI